MGKWMKVSDLNSAGLPDDVKLDVLTTVVGELGLALSLVMSCGDRMGGDRYASLGRALRFSREGEPLVLVAADDDPAPEPVVAVADLRVEEAAPLGYGGGGEYASMQTPATQPAYADGPPSAGGNGRPVDGCGGGGSADPAAGLRARANQCGPVMSGPVDPVTGKPIR